MPSFALKRPHIWLIIVAFLATVGGSVAGGALYIAYRGGTPECRTAIRRSIPSPDGSQSVVIFERECGATVGFNTQASISPAGSSFSVEKNPAFLVVSGRSDVTARWLGNGIVEISLIPGSGKVFRSGQTIGDIKVEYR